MKLLFFFIQMVVSGFVFILLYSIVNFPLMGLAWLVIKAGERNPSVIKPLTILMFPIGLFIQLFCASLWVLWVVGRTSAVIESPEVKHRWIYWVVAFFSASSPYKWLAHKENMAEMAAEGKINRRRDTGATLWIFATIALFFLFALYPPSMVTFHDWFLDWLVVPS